MHLNVCASKIGFTLAEVLITLGIIGVVAALTLPTLIQNYQEKARVTQLKKAYSVISQAFQSVIAEYGTLDTWDLVNTNTMEKDENGVWIEDPTSQILFMNRMKEYLQTVEITPVQKDEYSLSNVKIGIFDPDKHKDTCLQLQDGAVICSGWFFTSKDPKAMLAELWTTFPEKTVRIGVNEFVFRLYRDKVTPSEYSFEEYCDVKNSSGKPDSHQGRGCTRWVLENENMDYLHCDGLSWNGKTKCK